MNVMGSQAWFQAPCKTYIITNDCYLTWLQKNGGRLLVNEINYVSFDETHTHIYIYTYVYTYIDRQIDRQINRQIDRQIDIELQQEPCRTLLIAIQYEQERQYQCERQFKYLQLTMEQQTSSSKDIPK